MLGSPSVAQMDWMTLLAQKSNQDEIHCPSTTSLPAFCSSPSTSASETSFNLPSATSIVAPPHMFPFQGNKICDPFQTFKQKTAEEMREMVFQMAAMMSICIDLESIKQPKRRNVRISKDPQAVSARLRRERISERIIILQRLVPGGTKMDTASSMLDEAVQYMKFLKNQVRSMERTGFGKRWFTTGGVVELQPRQGLIRTTQLLSRLNLP